MQRNYSRDEEWAVRVWDIFAFSSLWKVLSFFGIDFVFGSIMIISV